MISLIAPILVFLLVLWLVARRMAQGQTIWRLWVESTAILAGFRLGVLWFLILLHRREALDLWAIPPIMLLLPEGFLLHRDQVWTFSAGVIASVLVTIGSALWTAAALAVLCRFRRAPVTTRR